MVPLAASVAIGLALRFAVPVPAGVTLQAWTLLAIFVSTIAGARLEAFKFLGTWLSMHVWVAWSCVKLEALSNRSPSTCMYGHVHGARHGPNLFAIAQISALNIAHDTRVLTDKKYTVAWR